MTDIIDGEAREVALEVIPEHEIVRLDNRTPAGTIELATQMATALADIVERQTLYTLIRGKKYPHVEAWMTIGRMDNVVCREVPKGVRKNEDGSWEAEVELIRLGDGLVMGYGSAMAGAKGDGDWTSRPDHVKRSMAVTRATSRAFRQQYSWIMALAGYQPTPADEMPQREPGQYDDPPDRAPLERSTNPENGLIGTVVFSGTQDGKRRETPDGSILPFRVKSAPNTKGQITTAHGFVADALCDLPALAGVRVSVWGSYSDESYEKRDKDDPMKFRTIRYTVLHVDRIKGPEFDLAMPDDPAAPADEATGPAMSPEEEAALQALPW